MRSFVVLCLASATIIPCCEDLPMKEKQSLNREFHSNRFRFAFGGTLKQHAIAYLPRIYQHFASFSIEEKLEFSYKIQF